MGNHSIMKRFGMGCAVIALAATALASVGGDPALGAAAIPKNDPGVGTTDALDNPMCDPTNKRVKFQIYSAPLCVKQWNDGDDNGGATAQGVTADTIKVVVLYGDIPPAQMAQRGLYVDQATGENSATAAVDSAKDWNKVFEYGFETWGRTVELEFVKASGNDEASQRADAVEVASRKPFAVLDEASAIGTPAIGGGAVFETALENAGVPLLVSSGASDPELLSRSYALPAAEFIGKQLKGGKAVHAGDEMAGQPRKFGVLYPNNVDIDYFKDQLAEYGVTIASEAMFNVPPGEISLQTSSPEIDQQIPPLVAKLKSDGVTNLIWMSSHGVANAATKAMKDQEWYPEITVAAFPYTDLDLLARSFDQDVWSHAFGLVWFLPTLESGAPTPIAQLFQWFWGTDKGTKWDGAYALLSQLYGRIQFAGPDLTKKTVEAVPARLRKFSAGIGGAYSDSGFTFEAPPLPAEGATPVRGAALGWWDPNDEGPGNYNLGAQGKGQYQYLDDARRYVAGMFPKAKKKFFDPDNSTSVFPALPASEPTWPTYPCDDCPSSGNTSIVPARGGQV